MWMLCMSIKGIVELERAETAGRRQWVRVWKSQGEVPSWPHRTRTRVGSRSLRAERV